MKPFSLIQAKVENNIAYMKLNNPPVNALNEKMMDEIGQCMDQLNKDSDVRAVILTGTGSFFVAGADIKELTLLFGREEEAKKAAERGQALFTKIEQSQKPVIAAINGACLGGGLELAMSCHMRIAAHEAKLGLPETNLGLIPGYGGAYFDGTIYRWAGSRKNWTGKPFCKSRPASGESRRDSGAHCTKKPLVRKSCDGVCISGR
jgi:enoyl-CoA hydratase